MRMVVSHEGALPAWLFGHGQVMLAPAVVTRGVHGSTLVVVFPGLGRPVPLRGALQHVARGTLGCSFGLALPVVPTGFCAGDNAG